MNKVSYSDKVKSIWLLVISAVFTLCIYIPFLIYKQNRIYFAEYFPELIFPILIIAILLIVLLVVLLALFPNVIFKYVKSLLVIVAILLWVQGDIFAVNYGTENGLTWDFWPFEKRGLLELEVMLACILLGIIFHKKINKYLPFVVIMIFIGQVALTGIYLILEPNDKFESTVDEEVYQFSSEKNVLVIVLDTFGSEYFEKILFNDPMIKDEFKGFVAYSDAISNYPLTKGSLPSFLMGEMIPNHVSYSDYLTQEVAHKGLPQAFSEKGYLSTVLSSSYIWFSHFYSNRFIFEIPETNRMFHNSSLQLFDYGLFRAMPHVLKEKIYNEGKWLTSYYLDKKHKYYNEMSYKAAMIFDYFIDKASAHNATPRFKFLHFTLPHPKFIFDQDCHIIDNLSHDEMGMLSQSKCALVKLKSLFRKLKKIGVYDESTIVVMSDHGARIFDNRNENGLPSDYDLKSSGILLMIKGVNSQAEFSQTKSPVSLLDVHKYLSNSNAQSGKVDWLHNNERYFYSYKNELVIKNNDLANGIIFKVSNKYSNSDSWEFDRVSLRNCDKSELAEQIQNINDEIKLCFEYGLSDYLSSKDGMKIEGDNVILVWKNTQMDVATKYSKLTISYEYETNQNLSAQMFLNGEFIKESHYSTPNGESVITFDFTDELYKKNTGTYELRMLLNNQKNEEPIRNRALKASVYLKNIVFKLIE